MLFQPTEHIEVVTHFTKHTNLQTPQVEDLCFPNILEKKYFNGS